jgi:hypothetical protein
MPALRTALFHGAIRTAHAVRAIDAVDTPPRRGALARALGYWAARLRCRRRNGHRPKRLTGSQLFPGRSRCSARPVRLPKPPACPASSSPATSASTRRSSTRISRTLRHAVVRSRPQTCHDTQPPRPTTGRLRRVITPDLGGMRAARTWEDRKLSGQRLYLCTRRGGTGRDGETQQARRDVRLITPAVASSNPALLPGQRPLPIEEGASGMWLVHGFVNVAPLMRAHARRPRGPRWSAAGGEGPLVGAEGEDVELALVCAAGQGHRRHCLPRLKGDVGGEDLRPDLL